MNYRELIGQKIRRNNKIGYIKEVDRNGYIKVHFDGELFSESYMFDPFLSGHLRFEDDKLQQEIDEKILEYNKVKEEYINKFITKNKKQAKFYLTKQNDKNEDEILFYLDCNIEEVYTVFSYYISVHSAEFRKNGKWKVIKVFDNITKRLICQES